MLQRWPGSANNCVGVCAPVSSRARFCGKILGVARNKNARAIDMFLSLAVILVPIVVIYYVFTTGPDDYPVERVDPTSALSTARAEAKFPVLAPKNLPENWVCNRAAWIRTGEKLITDETAPADIWRISYIGPNKIAYTVVQSERISQKLERRTTREGVPLDAVQISGVAWQRLLSKDDRTRALRAEVGGSTIIVAADTSFEALIEFAKTLSK